MKRFAVQSDSVSHRLHRHLDTHDQHKGLGLQSVVMCLWAYSSVCGVGLFNLTHSLIAPFVTENLQKVDLHLSCFFFRDNRCGDYLSINVEIYHLVLLVPSLI